MSSGAGSADAQVLILGGGITGCVAACLLADRGYAPVIVEQRERLMDAASRWNDGKLHLGYTFTGTDSLATATLMQQGSEVFVPILERVLGERLPESWLGAPTIYVVDRDSVFDAETLWRRARAVATLMNNSMVGRPGLAQFSGRLERMDVELARAETGQGPIDAAWRTPERHVSTALVARAIRKAVVQRDIEVVSSRVTGVSATDDGWRVTLSAGSTLRAPVVVNALWENRAAMDRLVLPVAKPAHVSIRYKVGLFGSSTGLERLTPSTRILGKFGDLATYDNGDAYLGWYPAGMSARSDDGLPPVLPSLDLEAITQEILDGLGLPRSVVAAPGSSWQVNGGFVVAAGGGDIDQRISPLHARDHIGVNELRPGFISVDTGKYTMGPLFGDRAASAVERRLVAVGIRAPSLAVSA